MKRAFKYIMVLAIVGGVGAYALHHTLASDGQDEKAAAPVAAAPAAMPISVSAALQKEINAWSEFSGRLRAVEDVDVRPRVSGVIETVHFKEGDIVKKGDLLFTLDKRPYKAAYDQAAAALASARAAAGLSQSDLTRAKGLLEQKAISQREYDARNSTALQAAASVKAAEAALELAALNLEYAEVKSPIDGRVGRPDITVGNLVQADVSAPVLTTVQSVDPVYADFDIDEQTYLRTMKAVRQGKVQDMPVFMALADETDFTREGRVRSFDNQLKADSGTIRVRAQFSNKDGILTPGLFARIRLGAASKHEAVMINDAAIGTDQDRRFVYTVDDKGDVNYRAVELGALTDGLREITGGLKAGEKIIVNGLQRVHPGMQVQPMMVAMDTLKPLDDKGAAVDVAPPSATPAKDTK
jgi:multidrug efflux system membrane fusion protein